MKFFVGRIDPSLTKRDLENYFNQFGYVIDVRLFEREKYGFVTFETPFNPEKLLANKEHSMDGKTFIVEKSKEQNRGDGYDRRDNIDRYERRDNHDRFDDRYERRDNIDRYERRDNYDRFDDRDGYDRRDNFDRFSRTRRDGYDSQRDISYGRRRCDYCDRCPIHGVQQPRESHPNGHLKIVVENIDSDVKREDLENFAIANGFRPTFTKTSFGCGFLEFKDVAEKDEALKKLDGAELQVKNSDGQVVKTYAVKTRSYVLQEQFHKDRIFKRRRYDAMDHNNDGGYKMEEDLRAKEMYKESEDKEHGEVRGSGVANGDIEE